MNWSLPKLFKKKNTIPFQLRTDHRVEVAFVHEGIEYYQFIKTQDTPYERALFAHLYYRELDMRISREDLMKYLDAEDELYAEILKGGGKSKQNINKLFKLRTHLRERIKLIVDPDLLVKLASVIYFDKNEDPYKYDMAYNQQKIARWKKDKGIPAFFLSLPIIDVLPFLQQSGIDTQTYLNLVEQIKGSHSKFLTSIQSTNTSKNETVNN